MRPRQCQRQCWRQLDRRLTETLRRQSALIESAFLKEEDLSKLQVLGAGKFSLRGALSTVEFME